LLVEDFDRADAEGSVRTLRISTACLVWSLVVRPTVAALLSSPHTRPGRYDFLLPKRGCGKTAIQLTCAPIGIYDSLICQVSGHFWMQRSELGRKIPVDLEADAHFDECRSCP